MANATKTPLAKSNRCVPVIRMRFTVGSTWMDLGPKVTMPIASRCEGFHSRVRRMGCSRSIHQLDQLFRCEHAVTYDNQPCYPLPVDTRVKDQPASLQEW